MTRRRRARRCHSGLAAAVAACLALLAGSAGAVTGASAAGAGQEWAGMTRPSPGWQWPLPPPHQVVHGFDPPLHNWDPGHRGVDLAGHAGERVRSAGAGVVSFAGPVAGVGVVAVVSGALRTTYQPLQVRVRRGQRVAAGAVLGTLSAAGSHCAPAACLHWGLLRGSAYLDPLSLLGLQQVRLLPLVSG